MDTQIFLEYLPLLRVPALKVESLGCGDDLIQATLRSTTAIPRESQKNFEGAPAELQKLFGEHDLGRLDFLPGTFFWSEPKKLDQGWGFAEMSEVNLVVAPSGRIEAYAAHPIRGMPGATDCLGILAKDLESYLEALFYAQFNKTHFISGFPDEDPILLEKTVLVAKHCALIAGGHDYYYFWAGALGLPPEKSTSQS